MGTHGGNGTPLGKGHEADRPGTRGRHLLARCVCVHVHGNQVGKVWERRQRCDGLRKKKEVQTQW